MALKIRVTCVFIEFSPPQITGDFPPPCGAALLNARSATLFDCFLPSLTESGVTAIRYRLHVFCINHTPLCQLQFHQLMFPAIVLPVTDCLHSRGEETKLWPTACLDLHIQCLCSLRTGSLSGILQSKNVLPGSLPSPRNKLTGSSPLLPRSSEGLSSTTPSCPHFNPKAF